MHEQENQNNLLLLKNFIDNNNSYTVNALKLDHNLSDSMTNAVVPFINKRKVSTGYRIGCFVDDNKVYIVFTGRDEECRENIKVVYELQELYSELNGLSYTLMTTYDKLPFEEPKSSFLSPFSSWDILDKKIQGVGL